MKTEMHDTAEQGLTYRGVTRSIAEWARDPEIVARDLDRRLIADRVRDGWSIEDALTKPRRPYGPQVVDGARYEDDPAAQRVVAENPNGATLDEVAAVLGVSRERARQLEERALKNLVARCALAGIKAEDIREILSQRDTRHPLAEEEVGTEERRTGKAERVRASTARPGDDRVILGNCKVCGVQTSRPYSRGGMPLRTCNLHASRDTLRDRDPQAHLARPNPCRTCGVELGRRPGLGGQRWYCDACTKPGLKAARAHAKRYTTPNAGSVAVAVDRIEPSDASLRIEALLSNVERWLVRAKSVGLTYSDAEAASPEKRARASARWDAECVRERGREIAERACDPAAAPTEGKP